jgi:acetyl-CoA acyltransferase
MRTAVITHYRRSPFHFASKGALAKVRPDDLAGQVIAKLVADSGIDPNDIEDIMMGCAFPEGEQGFNLGRLLAFIANLPISVAGATVNRFCGSSMQAIHMAVGAIAIGAGDVFVCAGVESMSRVPMMGFNPSPSPELYARYPQAYISMGRNGRESGEEISDLAREAGGTGGHLASARRRRRGGGQVRRGDHPDHLERRHSRDRRYDPARR